MKDRPIMHLVDNAKKYKSRIGSVDSPEMSIGLSLSGRMERSGLLGISFQHGRSGRGTGVAVIDGQREIPAEDARAR